MNIGSIIKLEYILPGDINSFSYTPGEEINLSAYLTGSFTELDISGEGELEQNFDDDKAGGLYKANVSAQKAGINSATTALLENLKRRRRIFRVTTPDQKQYLMGTPSNPARLSYSITSKSPSSFHGYNISINFSSPNGIVHLS